MARTEISLYSYLDQDRKAAEERFGEQLVRALLINVSYHNPVTSFMPLGRARLARRINHNDG